MRAILLVLLLSVVFLVIPPHGVEAQVRGCAPYHLANGTTASNNSTLVKAGGWTLCDLTLINTTSTAYFLKLYDTATAPTCSSATNLKHVYPILANGGIERSLSQGEAYVNGIGFCVVGGQADTDNTNAATGVSIEMSYTK